MIIVQLKGRLQPFLTKEFFTYLIVGFATFFLDIIVFWALFNLLGLWYVLAQALTSPLVLLFNYSSNRKLTFRSGGMKREQLPRYAALATFNYMMGIVLIYLFVDYLLLHVMIGKVLTIGVVVMYNFFALKKLVFVNK